MKRYLLTNRLRGFEHMRATRLALGFISAPGIQPEQPFAAREKRRLSLSRLIARTPARWWRGAAAAGKPQHIHFLSGV